MSKGTSFLFLVGGAALTIGAVYYLMYSNPHCQELKEEALDTCFNETKRKAYTALFFGVAMFLVFSLFSGEE